MTQRDTEIIVAKLEERDEARKEQINELKEVIVKGLKDINDRQDTMDERLTSVEGDIRFVKRVGAPVYAIALAAFNQWIGQFLRGQ